MNLRINLLYPEGFRDKEELINGLLLEEHFPSRELKEKVLSVTLAEWLRAFTVLRNISNEFIQKGDCKAEYILDRWCILKSKGDWLVEFEKGGINKINAEIIIENLVFSRDSDDLFDCPFIVLKDKLLLIPSIQAINAAFQSIPSNFLNQQLEVAFRGEHFEEVIRGLFVKEKIKCESLYAQEGLEEYQCDGVFMIDGWLFFIECKAFIQPDSLKEYLDFLYKLKCSSGQLNRIAGYFNNKIDMIAKTLGFSIDWKPNGFYKIIITKAMLGKCLFYDDCYYMDESSLKKFLSREQAGIMVNNVRILTNDLKDGNLDGQITAEKFINFLKNARHVYWTRENFILEEGVISWGDKKLTFEKWEKKTPQYGVVD